MGNLDDYLFMGNIKMNVSEIGYSFVLSAPLLLYDYTF